MTFLPTALAAIAVASTVAVAQTPWKTLHRGAPPLNDIASGGSLIVVVGDAGTLLTSADGANWTPASVPTRGTSLSSVGFGGGTWVVGAFDGRILRSTDGITWTQNAQVMPNRATAFAYQAGTFVATVADSLWHSADGIDWNRVTGFNTDNSGRLCVGGGQFLATGGFLANQNGSLLVSTNGIEWTAHPRPAQIIQSLGYGGDQFIIIGTQYPVGDQRAFLSQDLKTWSPGGIVRGVRPGALAFSGGIYMTAGANSPEMSTDGSAWSPGGSAGSGVIRTLIAFGGRFIGVGSDGYIRQSPDLLTADMTQPGVVRVSGPGGGHYEILASGVLETGAPWTKVGEVNLGSTPADWADPDTAAHAARWYRVEGR